MEPGIHVFLEPKYTSTCTVHKTSCAVQSTQHVYSVQYTPYMYMQHFPGIFLVPTLHVYPVHCRYLDSAVHVLPSCTVHVRMHILYVYILYNMCTSCIIYVHLV